MRIVTGLLRGRVIPSHRALGNIRLTSSRLKESLFSMLGTDLSDRTFLDLCAGSGQIGLEAFSRGARVTLNEADRRRCDRIRRLLRQWKLGKVELHGAKAQILIPQLQEQERRFDVVYLDPPYHATRNARPLSLELLEQLDSTTILSPGGLLLVQHQADLDLPATTGRLVRLQRRSYGNTDLSAYQSDPTA